jgi:FKBP-type peptidyl-prolyl cis-trans isomerase FkpA
MKKQIYRCAARLLLPLCFVHHAAHADESLENEKQMGREYLAQMAAEPGAITLASGVVLRTLHSPAEGQKPDISHNVKVVYQLFDREGALLDDGFAADDIPVFPLQRLISCWKIAIPQVTIGSIVKLSCPSDTAYGDKGVGPIRPGAALTFRIVLIDSRPSSP